MNWRRGIRKDRYQLQILPLAEEDIIDISDYIAFEKQAPQAALALVRGLRKEIKKLEFYPQRHEIEPDRILAEYGVRRHYYKNYKIFYIIEENEKTVYIVRVLHMLVDSRAELLKFFT